MSKAFIAPTAAAATLIQTYIESYHEALEEAYVFPRLEQAGRLTATSETEGPGHGTQMTLSLPSA